MTDGTSVLYGLGALSAAHVLLPVDLPGRGLLSVAGALLGAAAGASVATTHSPQHAAAPAGIGRNAGDMHTGVNMHLVGRDPDFPQLSVRTGHKGQPRPWTPHTPSWASHVDYEHEHLPWYPPGNAQTKQQTTRFSSPIRGWRPHEPGGQIVTEGVPAMGTVFPKTRGEEALTVGPLDSDLARRPPPGLDPVGTPLPPVYTARANLFGGGVSHSR